MNPSRKQRSRSGERAASKVCLAATKQTLSDSEFLVKIEQLRLKYWSGDNSARRKIIGLISRITQKRG